MLEIGSDIGVCMKFYSTAAEACAALGIAVPQGAAKVGAQFPVYLNDYYLRLIDPALGAADPIARQALPDLAELADQESSFDPLAEEYQMASPRLIRRYVDRAVLVTTGRCAMHCRFCFRKRSWTTGRELGDLSDAELDAAADYLRRMPEVREVLISGGDPLMLPEAKFRRIVEVLSGIGSIDVLRVATRLPVVWPQRVDEALCRFLAATPGLWVATHFNHPRELTDEARAACARMVSAGIPVVNQTVLLRGVNDDATTLETLFRALVSIRVKPHYLFHVDPVRGVRHFSTGIEAGLAILRAFRPRLSSLAVPAFAIDLPEGGGKVALQPAYGCDGEYLDLDETRFISYEDRLP